MSSINTSVKTLNLTKPRCTYQIEFFIFSCSAPLSVPCSPAGSRDPDCRCCPECCCSSAIAVLRFGTEEGGRDLTSRPRPEPQKQNAALSRIFTSRCSSCSCPLLWAPAHDSQTLPIHDFSADFHPAWGLKSVRMRSQDGIKPLIQPAPLHFTTTHFSGQQWVDSQDIIDSPNPRVQKGESILKLWEHFIGCDSWTAAGTWTLFWELWMWNKKKVHTDR